MLKNAVAPAVAPNHPARCKRKPVVNIARLLTIRIRVLGSMLSVKLVKALTVAFMLGKNFSPTSARKLKTLSCSVLIMPCKLSATRSELPAILAAGSINVLNNADLNSGKVSLVKSSIFCDNATILVIPASFNISLAAAPPLKARPIAKAAS